MERLNSIFKLISAWVCAMITFLWGKADTIFCVLLCVMVIDYITGVLCAVKEKKLSSKIGFNGLLKKIGILLIVALSQMCANVLSIPETRSVVIGFYIANEGISILENTKRLGVPLPQKLKDILEKMME